MGQGCSCCDKDYDDHMDFHELMTSNTVTAQLLIAEYTTSHPQFTEQELLQNGLMDGWHPDCVRTALGDMVNRRKLWLRPSPYPGEGPTYVLLHEKEQKTL
jgi:hypothetical protein